MINKTILYAFVLSVMMMSFCAIIINNLNKNQTFIENNLYGDRLKRNAIFILILSIIGLLFVFYGIYNAYKSDNVRAYLTTADDTNQFMTYVVLINLFILILSADMMNSINSASGYSTLEGGDLVKTLVIVMLVFSCVTVAGIGGYQVYKMRKTGEDTGSVENKQQYSPYSYIRY